VSTRTDPEARPRERAHPRGLRALVLLLAVAFAVSVVHYVDNVANYTAYPQPGPSDLPAPSAGLIAGSWFVFTAFGVAGLWLFVRRRVLAAAGCLTAYSLSGLVGIGHYLVPGATAMVWWRQAHVVIDIVCGLLVFGFALWSVVTQRRPRTGGS
jgi:apolipoprotein N-acyltransferase